VTHAAFLAPWVGIMGVPDLFVPVDRIISLDIVDSTGFRDRRGVQRKEFML
jgi:hypothetical protein